MGDFCCPAEVVVESALQPEDLNQPPDEELIQHYCKDRKELDLRDRRRPREQSRTHTWYILSAMTRQVEGPP